MLGPCQEHRAFVILGASTEIRSFPVHNYLLDCVGSNAVIIIQIRNASISYPPFFLVSIFKITYMAKPSGHNFYLLRLFYPLCFFLDIILNFIVLIGYIIC